MNNFDELVAAVLAIFPDAEIGEENGEIVIATGITRKDDNTLEVVSF